jgi:saposin
MNLLKFQEKMKEALQTVCKKLSSFEGKCEEFVSTYGDAIVAILVQEIDPSQVNICFYI